MTVAFSRSLRSRKAGVSAERSEPAGPAGEDGVPRLRLAAARGTLGLELDAPFALRPLRIVALSLTFPNIRFPIDLSGGVTRFRHRRGALARLAIEAVPVELATWVAPRLRGLLRDGTPEIWLAPIEGGVAIGLADGDAALAFDTLVLPDGPGLMLVVERARGIGLGVPPQALALRALAAALGSHAQVQAGGLPLPDAAAALLRAALPAAGARSPSVTGVRWDVARVENDRLRLEAQIDAAPPALPDRLLRASETLLLCAEAEDAAYRGDAAHAREHYLLALERAPRHPEISERLAWLDAIAGERAEAALSTLIDVVPAVDAGLLGAELLAAVGDADGARGALAQAARAEPFGPLAARTWLRAAALADDQRERLAALDEAVARAPALAEARWARLTARLAVADPRGALADAEHLEAAARGARLRHEIARTAARAFLAEGYAVEAHRLFERALRYLPSDAEAVAGLARTLAAQGSTRRALDLYARALGLAERAGAPTSAVAIDLAKALVDVAADRPAAIARVRGVPASAPEAAEARLLEARWRAELGDVAGAGLAIGRLRDHAEREPVLGLGAAGAGSPAAARAAAMGALLAEAATIDERTRDDLAGAQRDLGLALRLLPRDARLQAAFRRVARESARRAGGTPPLPVAGGPAMPSPPRRSAAAVRGRAPDSTTFTSETGLDSLPAAPGLTTQISHQPPLTQPSHSLAFAEPAPSPVRAQPAPSPVRAQPAPSPMFVPAGSSPVLAEPAPSPMFAQPAAPAPSADGDDDDDDAESDDVLAERLSERLRGNPRDRATVIALCDVLERLGRDLELFALVAARMDEGDEGERATLAPRKRAVLARLAERARALGNASEAELYEMMLSVEA